MEASKKNKPTAKAAQVALRKLGNPRKAQFLQGFFRTAPGEYAHGDKFLGITVPDTRAVAKDFADLPLGEIRKLLSSPWHEERLMALVILNGRYARAKPAEQDKIFAFYLKHLKYVNNWDLVDSSAHQIVGTHLKNRSRKLLHDLAKSSKLWERRVAVVSTFAFIRDNDHHDTLTLAKNLLDDSEDLIHKAVGWMLREAGKKNTKVLRGFLDRYAAHMPRTMLRYALEKLPPRERKKYMAAKKPAA